MPDDNEDRFKLPDLPSDEEISMYLGRLKEEEEAKKEDLPPPPDWDYKRQSKPLGQAQAGSMTGIAFGLSLLYTLLAPIFGGYVIGWLIDRPSHGETGKTYGVLIGLIAGFAAMVFTAFRFMSRESKK